MKNGETIEFNGRTLLAEKADTCNERCFFWDWCIDDFPPAKCYKTTDKNSDNVIFIEITTEHEESGDRETAG